MSPPFFANLGSEIKRVLKDGYPYGKIKVDLKTKHMSGGPFTTDGVVEQGEPAFYGTLSSTYNFNETCSFTEKWDTKQQIVTTFTCCDGIMKGLKMIAEGKFLPQSG